MKRISLIFSLCLSIGLRAPHVSLQAAPKNTLTTLCTTALLFFSLQNQVEARSMVKTLNGTGSRIGRGIAQIYDYSCSVVGGYQESNSSDEHIFLTRFDSEGDLMYEHIFEMEGTQRVRTVTDTLDTCFLMAGDTDHNGGDGLIVKFNNTGAQQWGLGIGGIFHEQINAIAYTVGSHVVAVGKSNTPSNGYTYDAMLLKLNAAGEVIYTRTFGGGGNDTATSIAITQTSQYIIAGSIHYLTQGMMLARYSSAGDRVWVKAFLPSEDRVSVSEVNGTFAGADVAITSTKDYILVGTFFDERDDPSRLLISKVNKTGVEDWIYAYGGRHHTTAHSVAIMDEDDFVVVGSYEYENGEKDALVTVFNKKGDRKWAKRYSEGAYTVAYHVVINDENQIVVTGSTQEDETADKKMFMAKFESNGRGCLQSLSLRKKKLHYVFGALQDVTESAPYFYTYNMTFQSWIEPRGDVLLCDSAPAPMGSLLPLLASAMLAFHTL